MRPEDSAILVLGGANEWGRAIAPFAAKAREFLATGVPVATTCGATSALAAEGMLDDREHTGAAAPALEMTGYAGGAHYREADAVTDDDVITAGPTDPEASAREIFARLDLLEPRVLDAWFRLFAHSDAETYEVAAAGGVAPRGPERPRGVKQACGWRTYSPYPRAIQRPENTGRHRAR